MSATEVAEGCGLVGLLLVKPPGENKKAEREVLLGCSLGGGSDRMAERIGLSSLSQGERSSTPLRGQERSTDFYLAISNQPPSHVFPDEPFEVAFSLESYQANPANSPPSDIRITVGLDENIGGSDMKLIILEEPRLSLSRRSGRTRCCIQRSQPIEKNQVAAKLRFTASGVGGCSTNLITLVRAKLKVSVGENWTDVWYKDEGGRDKCIETIVTVHDRHNNLVREALQLEIKLCYDAKGTPDVSNQDILKRLGSERGLQIDPETGRAKIRFRVEDVSKNHQGQNFVLMISAAKPDENVIAFTSSPPVNVRSKRNKRQRTGSARGSSQDMSQGDSGTQLLSKTGAVAQNEQLREAVQDVIRWTEEAVNGMYHIHSQWQVMGYASNADGTVDYSRPFYQNMQNPSPIVDRIISLYNQSTRENIRYLQHAVVDSPSTPGDPYSMVRTPVPMQHGGMIPPNVRPPLPEMGGHGTPGGSYPMPRTHPGLPMHPTEPYGEATSLQHYTPPHSEFYTPPTAKSRHEDRLEPLPAHTERGPVSPAMDRESEVEYVLARQYKSLRTGERLGFPAYSAEREILGFYHDSPRSAGLRQFIPISDQDFGPSEKLQAKKILEDAINTNSRAVQAVKDCGSLAVVLDRCLVYDFSKDIGGGSSE